MGWGCAITVLPVIVSAGEALVDLVPEPVPGGGPMNVAVAAARLGVSTAFLGRVSTDRHGEMIWRHLEESGVDLRVAERGGEPTCQAAVDGDPPVFTFDGHGTADAALTSADLTALGPGPHLLHGGTLALFREPAAEVYARLAETHDGLVSLDPNVRPRIIDEYGRAAWFGWFDRWLSNTALLRASDADLDWLWPGRPVADVASALFDRGVRALIVTTSSGATCHTPGGSASASSQRVEVVDTVGAGDSFCAGVLARLHELDVRTPDRLDSLHTADWEEVLGFACRVASVTVSRPGADPPLRDEVPPA